MAERVGADKLLFRISTTALRERTFTHVLAS
jgi:hypothetical protein